MTESKIRRFLIVIAAVFSLWSFVMLSDCRHRLVWNASPSFPTGLYHLDHAANVERGDLVYFDEPAEHLQLARARHYMPAQGHFLKIADGLPGDTYCVTSVYFGLRVFTVRGEFRGFVYATDSSGRSLSSVTGCHEVPEGHFLPTAPEPRSYDGRYFGTAPVSSITGVARPLFITDDE